MAQGDSSSSKDDFPTDKSDSLGPAMKRPKLDASEVKAMSTKQYMDELIVPVLLKGLSACTKERPTDPIDYLAHYLLDQNKLSKISEDTEMTENIAPV